MDYDEEVGTPLSRREAVATLGMPAQVWFARCSEDGVAGGDRTRDGNSPPDPGATHRRTGDTKGGGTTTTTAASAERSVTDVGTGTRSTTAANACVARPALVEGPAAADEDCRRSDVRVDTSTGRRVDGVPLELGFNVYAITEDSCSRLPDATVGIWQADATGTYSGEASDGTEDRDFLRGTQATDERGHVSFTTIYPGWCPGRRPHVNFTVRSPADPGTVYDFTSLLFFREERSDEVYRREPYRRRPDRDTRNDDDPRYRSTVPELVLDLESTSEGYAATFDVALHTY